ncbi:MAG: nucleotidyltransferase family protein [Bacteroidetes bacterium]|nr:nucleotidyltransferase family protein [Bacteroidota bacterium]
MDLRKEDLLLIAASRLNADDLVLAKAELLKVESIDWENFCKRALDTYLAPLLYNNFKKIYRKDLLPEKPMAFLRKSYQNVLARNIRLFNDYKQVSEIFTNAGLAHAPLKGIFLGTEIYKDIGLRHTSDIDLLVREKDVEIARDALLKSGWRLIPQIAKSKFIANITTNPHPYQLSNGLSTIELHVHIHNSPKTYQVIIEDYWKLATIKPDSEHEYILNPACLIQHLCIHLDKHLWKGKTKFISFIDIDEVVRHYGNKLDWNLLENINKKYNCEQEVLAILFVCQKYLESPIPAFLFDGKHLETSSLETKFIGYLQNNQTAIKQKLSDHNISTFKNLPGIKPKLQYLLSDFFPSKEFMISNYRLKSPGLAYIFYLFRFGVGIWKLMRYAVKRII